MTFANPIIDAGVAGLIALYDQRAVTPVEATQAYLSRIERLGGPLNAYTSVDEAGALAAAQASASRWAEGEPLSGIDGVPVAIKGNIAVKGMPLHAGIGARRNLIATEDAACVAALREAGAVILGMLNMHEGAVGATTDNEAFGKAHNPYATGLTAGGSSGGSGSAVAAGLCAGALGTDTLGSVRIPASFCGVVGHKPTQGLISMDGVVALSWTLDHVGVLARSAQDCAYLLAHAAAVDGDLAESFSQIADLDVLKPAPFAALDLSGFGDVIDPELVRAYDAAVAAAREAGLEIETIDLEGYDFAAMLLHGYLIMTAEGAVSLEQDLASGPEGFSEAGRSTFQWGASQPAADLARAYRAVGQAVDLVKDALTPYAALLLPATPGPAFSFAEGAVAHVADFTALGDFLGMPACVAPIGLTRAGLPLSIQALAWDDETALGLADVMSRLAGSAPTPALFRG
jgi:aspartyl-tRNA(Asn)/glutamyl-tRNA(Gln) amidotransferase subunit A